MSSLVDVWARCFETLRDRFDEWSADLSLAEHLFFRREYEKALKLNLRLGDRLYDLFDYGMALQLIKRAKTGAEEVNDRDLLAAALHQNGRILQSIYRFPDSLNAYNQSLEIEREVGNKSGEVISLWTIEALKEEMLKKK